jgi:uncharacterized membrane protein
MTRSEFLSKLDNRLRALPENERRDAIEYYEGYLDDAAEDEEAAIERLGSPAEVAANIIADYAVNDTAATADEPETPKRRRLSTTWAVILAIFALPIGLPIALAAVSVAIALLVVVFSLLLSFGATAFALVAAGAFGLIMGFAAIFQNMPLAIMYLGAALFTLGIGIVFIKLTAVMASTGFQAVAKFAGKIIIRRGKNE